MSDANYGDIASRAEAAMSSAVAGAQRRFEREAQRDDAILETANALAALNRKMDRDRFERLQAEEKSISERERERQERIAAEVKAADDRKRALEEQRAAEEQRLFADHTKERKDKTRFIFNSLIGIASAMAAGVAAIAAILALI